MTFFFFIFFLFIIKNNYMRRNTDKSHLLVSGIKYENKVWESNEVKLLGVTVDNKLKFYSYFANIYFKANQKLRALSSLAKLLSFNKEIILFKACFDCQFIYNSLTWMFCNRRAINRANKRQTIGFILLRLAKEVIFLFKYLNLTHSAPLK